MVLNDVMPYATSSRLVLAVLVLVAVLSQGPAHARDSNREVLSDPVYHEASGSYFQVVHLPETTSTMGFAHARAMAARKEYKGRRGRLAKVDNPSIHSFIARELEFKERAFIGLRFVCSTRRLIWLDGSEHQNGFEPWSRSWYRAVDNCARSRIPFMAVTYLPTMRWQAQGHVKFGNYYIVEYPSENAE